MVQKIFTTILFLSLTLLVNAQGIEFEHGSWAEAIEKAKAEDKMLFVDGYAVWCGPCKRLAKTIFPLANVGDFYNANFINVKMDMEKGDGLKFRKKYPVSAFPTLLFIAPDGELVHSIKGAPRTPEALIDLGRQATKKFDRSAAYMTKYEAGDRSYETMYNLVKGLNKSKKPSLKYANEYLRSQDDLSTDENVKFLFEAMTQVDSRLFDDFVAHKSKIESNFSSDEIHDRVLMAANKTVDNAIDYSFIELVEEAQQKYQTLYPSKAKAFEKSSNVRYAIGAKDASMFLANAKYDGDSKEKKELINTALKVFPENEKVAKVTEKWAKSLAADEGDAASYYLLAMTQVKQEKVSHAIKSLEKCMEKSEKGSREQKIYQEHLSKLKSLK